MNLVNAAGSKPTGSTTWEGWELAQFHTWVSRGVWKVSQQMLKHDLLLALGSWRMSCEKHCHTLGCLFVVFDVCFLNRHLKGREGKTKDAMEYCKDARCAQVLYVHTHRLHRRPMHLETQTLTCLHGRIEFQACAFAGPLIKGFCMCVRVCVCVQISRAWIMGMWASIFLIYSNIIYQHNPIH